MKILFSILLLAASPSFAADRAGFDLGSMSAQSIAADKSNANTLSVPVAVPVPAKQPKSAVFNGIEIKGSEAFSTKTKEALTLLKGSANFKKVSPYIAVITEGDHSGMAAYAAKPTFEVSSKTWTQPTEWYAGTIAHDGYHSLLYHQAKASTGRTPADDVWTGASAEKTCLAFQEAVLTELKADYYAKYVHGLISDPEYQNIPYSQRNW